MSDYAPSGRPLYDYEVVVDGAIVAPVEHTFKSAEAHAERWRKSDQLQGRTVTVHQVIHTEE